MHSSATRAVAGTSSASRKCDDPKRRRELTLLTLVDQLEGLARRHPVLLLFEDAHWADSTSLELLDRIVECLPHLPVLCDLSAGICIALARAAAGDDAGARPGLDERDVPVLFP